MFIYVTYPWRFLSLVQRIRSRLMFVASFTFVRFFAFSTRFAAMQLFVMNSKLFFFAIIRNTSGNRKKKKKKSDTERQLPRHCANRLWFWFDRGKLKQKWFFDWNFLWTRSVLCSNCVRDKKRERERKRKKMRKREKNNESRRAREGKETAREGEQKRKKERERQKIEVKKRCT